MPRHSPGFPAGLTPRVLGIEIRHDRLTRFVESGIFTPSNRSQAENLGSPVLPS